MPIYLHVYMLPVHVCAVSCEYFVLKMVGFGEISLQKNFMADDPYHICTFIWRQFNYLTSDLWYIYIYCVQLQIEVG